MLSTVENVCLSGLLIVILYEHLLYDILYLLNCAGLSFQLFNNFLGQICKIDACHLLAVYCLIGCVDGVEDLGLIEFYFFPVTFDDSVHNLFFLLFFVLCFLLYEML